MKRRRELEEMMMVVVLGSEVRSAIQELSTSMMVVAKVKPAAAEEEEDGVRHHPTSIAYIPLKPFLAVCNFLIQVLDKIGPTMAVLRQDIHQNIQRLEKFYETEPSVYSNVVEILKKETAEGKAKKGPTCSKAFVWLTRSLDFSVALLKLLVEDFERNMEKAVEESYNITLKPWHGWISAAAYRVALKLVPDSKTFIALLMAKDENDDMLKEELQSLISLLVPVLEDIHAILGSYELDRLKSA